MQATQAGSFKWVQTKIGEIKKQSADTTIAIVATEGEVKNLDFKAMIPESGEDDFLADLKMSQTHWFYFESKRTLLIAKNADKEDAKREDTRKAWRSLGASACSALQEKKLLKV